MRRYILLFSIILSCITTYGQEHKVKTIDKSKDDYYPWITFLSEGEINWSDKAGIAFRLVITTSEIYDDIFIEKISEGEEGGGKKIEWKRQIDRDSLRNCFGFEGEISGIKLIKWISWNSFELKIQDRKFLFKNLESDKISAKEVK